MEIDWNKDYLNEFVCPQCNKHGLKLWGWTTSVKNRKRRFKCLGCGRRIPASHNITLPNLNSKVNWRQDYKIGEFVCPNIKCNTRNVKLHISNKGKQLFRCVTCGTSTVEAIDLIPEVVSRFSNSEVNIKQFSFNDDKWDLRTLIPSFNNQRHRIYANFEDVQQEWFKNLVKNYIYHQAKVGNAPGTIMKDLSHLRIFSRYLSVQNITSVHEINRDIFLNLKSWDKTGDEAFRSRLGTLRKFFQNGTIRDWFRVDQDIIRDEDYPKKKRSNPDPISDTVREQIENNLHRLPDPIARMWLIAFFTAMRPSELALLKKDCLVQEGSDWKVVWGRKKVKDQHELPITRTIAKVIQEQQEYIEQLWGDSWDYLFCHYHWLSKTIPSQPKLQPVKKVILIHENPLKVAIRCLIEALDFQDENGEPAKFSPCLIRSTRLTQLFDQGHDLAVVSAWAGHKHMATTALYYTHVSCDLIEKETGHIQKALFNADGQYLRYESFPKSFWNNPIAHQLDLPGNHINTPIYGYCSLPLDKACDKFRACYTCKQHFVAVPEKLSLYVKTRGELRAKETRAMEVGADVLVEQYQRQADQLSKIISSLEITS